jgi:hypothetical protein
MTDTRKDLEYKKFIMGPDGISIRTSVADDKEILPMPNFTIEDLEYRKFINTPDGPAIKFTNVGAWPVLQTWEAGHDYKFGEIVNSGSDGNWLFKVIQDHTSTDVPDDVANGNLLAISPPLISTGVQAGGEVLLSGNLATVNIGTGFVAIYGTSASAYPLITIIEWPTQNITLPSTGIFTLFIDSQGGLGFNSGFTDERDVNSIIVGIVDMNLGKSFDTKTYPTNPVGQLRSLAFFFGGMTKGLKYSATNLQLSRSAYETYVWGTNNIEPEKPNTKSHLAKSPVEFYEYTQTGAVIPPDIKTTLRNNVYDLNGTLVPMGNNKWGFIRIYTSLAEEDYIMYSQAEYFTESDAKEAATSGSFIKPIDLTLTKFSAWFVFEKGDLDFNNNQIIVCEPFGCDKMGTSGGGGAVSGDVFGPQTSVIGNIAIFADNSGKLISDSGTAGMVLINTLDKLNDLEKRIIALENK